MTTIKCNLSRSYGGAPTKGDQPDAGHRAGGRPLAAGEVFRVPHPFARSKGWGFRAESKLDSHQHRQFPDLRSNRHTRESAPNSNSYRPAIRILTTHNTCT